MSLYAQVVLMERWW